MQDAGTLQTDEVFALLALEPLTREQVRAARGPSDAIARRSRRQSFYMLGLVLVVMGPAIATQNPSLMVFGAIPIVGYAVWLSVRLFLPGGTLAQAYAASNELFAPLGLEVVERPDISFEPRPSGDGMQPRLRGPTVVGGDRHGRRVQVSLASGRSTTVVIGDFGEWSASVERQRFRVAGEGVPREVGDFLASLAASPRWTSVEVVAGPEGIVVKRKSSEELAWLYDLWLAEQLAAARGH